MQLKDKVAVITGGDSGIGLASARLFLNEGANVVVMSNNADTLRAAHDLLGARVVTIEADVTDAHALVDAFAEVGRQFGHIDVLLASAGVVSPTPLEGTSSELVERILRINVAGSFYTVQAALPYLRSGSSVILIGSVVATMGVGGFGIYAASKAGISGMARALASELTPKGIRVNTLVPGPTRTPIWNTIAQTEAQLQELEESLVRTIPIGRLNDAEEVAQAALFLASNYSSSMQAAEMLIDGGASRAPQGAPAYRP
ncbi:SDR family NAD(P)-dependent oxidoreductase [Paraburkholderia susongensis]|uniref:NAD(P)-dependent dehydrogenase, short-chain alcohol dehydrogenase family n=1 Tax=Paraburkholderia susongensis TaxID=1515439 RepID=A0A1X7J8W4_9BURK|nr:SDR family oxidoreductase [Paraburkholderia susongensis]SMG23744.1 NAD(P)-dependent dehydrogenase, short-chain alcohol dehydrogenase family [Paraburkholderia susongensis]